MTRIRVVTTATAIVTEEWLVDVSDDELADIKENASEARHYLENAVDVKDLDVSGETDREVVEWEIV